MDEIIRIIGMIGGKSIVQYPHSKIHGANMGPIWALSAPGRPHVGPMNLAIRDTIELHWLPKHKKTLQRTTRVHNGNA